MSKQQIDVLLPRNMNPKAAFLLGVKEGRLDATRWIDITPDTMPTKMLAVVVKDSAGNLCFGCYCQTEYDGPWGMSQLLYLEWRDDQWVGQLGDTVDNATYYRLLPTLEAGSE